MKTLLVATLVGLSVGGSALAGPAGDAAAGKAAFDQRCAMCHASATGVRSPMAPNLFGVATRVSGAGEFTNYSPALKKAALKWDAPTLDQFLTAPNKMVPGTRMVISTPDGQKRADLVAYLTSLKKK